MNIIRFFPLKMTAKFAVEVASSRKLTGLHESVGLVAIRCIFTRFFERFRVAFVCCHAWSLLPSLFLCCCRACDFKSLPLSQASTNRMENITTKSSANLEEVRQDNFSN